MGEHEPRLFDHDQRRPTREPLLDAVEEVGEDRHRIHVAHVHQVLHLEDLEAAFGEAVFLGIEKAPGGPLQRVVAQPVANLAILDGVDEVREGAALTRPEALERHVNGLAVGRRDLNALKPEKDLEPALGPDALLGAVGRGQRIEGELLVLVSRDVVVVPSGGVCEDEAAVALVEGEDLGPWVAKELRHHQADQRRLPGARGADHQRVAHVGHVEVEAEGGRPRGVRVEERGAPLQEVGTRVLLEARPDARRWNQVGEVQRVDERPANVSIAVTGDGSQVGLEGVHVLKA